MKGSLDGRSLREGRATRHMCNCKRGEANHAPCKYEIEYLNKRPKFPKLKSVSFSNKPLNSIRLVSRDLSQTTKPKALTCKEEFRSESIQKGQGSILKRQPQQEANINKGGKYIQKRISRKA